MANSHLMGPEACRRCVRAAVRPHTPCLPPLVHPLRVAGTDLAVATCTSCVLPVASASGPGVIMPACAGSALAPITFSALFSRDTTGRGLTNVEWFFPTSGFNAPDAAAAAFVRDNVLPAAGAALASKFAFQVGRRAGAARTRRSNV